MAKIKLTLCDDEGNPIAGVKAKDYAIEVGNETLDEIEAAVEDFRLKALPEIEADLLNGEHVTCVKCSDSNQAIEISTTMS